jgi:hypothetical protein
MPFGKELCRKQNPEKVANTSTQESDRLEKKSNKAATLMAIFLAINYIAFFKFDQKIFQHLSFLAILIPCWILMKAGMTSLRIAFRSFAVAVPYLLFSTVSLLLNFTALQDPGHMFLIQASLWYAFACAAVLGSTQEDEFNIKVMKKLFFLTIPVLLYVLVEQKNAYNMGRWMPYYTGDDGGAHPNWWGLVCVGVGWCSLAFEKKALRFLGLAVVLYFIFLLQARGALIALIPAFFFCSGYFIPMTAKRAGVLLGVCILFVLLALSINFDSLIKFVENDVLLFNDPTRGLGTGMSGRAEGYMQVWQALGEAPFLGNGPDAFYYIHNGYLLTIASGGLFSLAGFLFLLVTCLSRLVRNRAWFDVGCVLSYATVLMTYPRTFNINITSLLIIMILMRAAGMKKKTEPIKKTSDETPMTKINPCYPSRLLSVLFVAFILYVPQAHASNAPPQAAAVGYSTNTFSEGFSQENVDFLEERRTGKAWYFWNFWSTIVPSTALELKSNGVGSLVAVNGIINGQIATATLNDKKPSHFVGTAFGGGAYFEATMAFDPEDVVRGGPESGCPTFWTMAIEALTRHGWDHWPGQPIEFEEYIEMDFMEYGFASHGEPKNFYGTDMHHFYGIFAKTCKDNAFCGYSRVSGARTEVSAKTDFTRYHRYGYLWVPATDTTPGYGQSYFDDKPVGERLVWTKAPDDAAPPLEGKAWAFSLIDKQHHVLILGSGKTSPLKVKRVNVWQATDANNYKF